jgi:hypothetical protein
MADEQQSEEYSAGRLLTISSAFAVGRSRVTQHARGSKSIVRDPKIVTRPTDGDVELTQRAIFIGRLQ